MIVVIHTQNLLRTIIFSPVVLVPWLLWVAIADARGNALLPLVIGFCFLTPAIISIIPQIIHVKPEQQEASSP